MTNDSEAQGMSVTPALLSATVCRQLIRDITERYNRDWVYVLLEQAQAHLRDPANVLGWTEYTLYYLTLERHDVFDQFHYRPKIGDRHLLCAESVWYPEDVKTLNMSKYFEKDDTGLFAVFQSTAGLSIRHLKAEIQKYFMLVRLSPDCLRARLQWHLGTLTGIENMAWKLLSRTPKAFQRFTISAFEGRLKGAK